MSIPFHSPINLNFLELLNARVQHLAADPTENLVSGFVYFNTASNRYRGYNGTGWVFLDNPAYTHPNHTGDVTSSGDGALTYNNTVPVTKGGTGQSTYTNGQLLIGNTTGGTLAKATLTQGSGITITNGAGSITLAHTAHTGDVTGATALTIAADAVTNTKLANMAVSTIKGRATAGTGDPEDLTAAQVRTILNVADGATANTGTVTSVAAGVGMSFTSITGTGSVALGTPSTITTATTNSVSGTTHTHALSITAADIGASATGHTHTFASLTSKPTTLAGYGITDAAAATHNHTGVYEPVLPAKTGMAGRALTVNLTEDGYEYVAIGANSGGANAKYASGTIPTTGWIASSTDYAYELTVPDINIVSTDILSIAIDKNDLDTAMDCELAPAVDSSTGAYTFYANSVPAATIAYTYVAVQTTAATSVILGELSTQAYFGDRGKIAYDHSQAAHAPSNAQANQTVTAGAGMNFTATSGNVTVAMGTPSTLTGATTNSASGTTHTHAITGFEPTISKATAFNVNFETSTANIKMDGAVSVGALSTVARADHIHPTDTSRASTAVATTGANGLMSSTDKTKLDGIATGANLYVHPSYTTRSIDTSGATIIDVLTSDASGHVTNVTTRTLTMADLGYTMQTTLTDSDTAIPTSGAVVDYVAAAFGANDAMIYKGVLDCSANPNYPAGDSGHTYKVSVAGKIGGASGPAVEVGDMIICTVDGTLAGDHATRGANWTIVQNNIDGAVVGPASTVAGNFASFSGTTGKLIADSGYSAASFATSGHNHTLDALSNTTITANSAGEILKWDGAAWINNTLAEAGIATAGHTHGQLHDRSHAMTSTADHTAGNWKLFHSNGSGQIIELSLGAAGTVLQANGASAAPTFVTPVQPATATPLANSGSGAVGTATKYAREDHVHPITTRKYTADIPAQVAPTFSHNFGTDDLVISVYDKTTKKVVYCDVEYTNTNTATLRFAVAPAANAYRVVIMG